MIDITILLIMISHEKKCCSVLGIAQWRRTRPKAGKEGGHTSCEGFRIYPWLGPIIGLHGSIMNKDDW